MTRFIGPLSQYLKQRQAERELRDIDPLSVASLCVDLVFAEITRAMFRGTVLGEREIVNAADRITQLIFDGIKPTGPVNL